MNQKDYKNLTEEELKEEFLKYFTLKDWDAQERCAELDKITNCIVSKFLPMDFVPTVFDKIKDESFYDKKLDAIIINEDYLYKPDVSIRLLLMELRHRYQIKVLANSKIDNEMIITIKEELKNDNYPKDYDNVEELSNYLYLTKSIDRFAFMLVMLKEIWDLPYHYPQVIYDEIIHQYANRNKDILINL